MNARDTSSHCIADSHNQLMRGRRRWRASARTGGDAGPAPAGGLFQTAAASFRWCSVMSRARSSMSYSFWISLKIHLARGSPPQPGAVKIRRQNSVRRLGREDPAQRCSYPA